MADFSEMLQNILKTDEGKQGFAQAMSMLEGKNENSSEENQNNSLNSDSFPIDPTMLIKMQQLFSQIPKHDKNTEFIRALKPLLKPERQTKADEAIKMMKIFSMLPILQKSGMLGQILSG
jgi:hypothetical protein